MTADDTEHRVSWRELAAAAVIGFLAGYGAVALVSHFVFGYRVTVGALPPRPCSLGFQHHTQPLVDAAGYGASQPLQRSVDISGLSRTGAPMLCRAARKPNHIRFPGRGRCPTPCHRIVGFVHAVPIARPHQSPPEQAVLCLGAAAALTRCICSQMKGHVCRRARCHPGPP